MFNEWCDLCKIFCFTRSQCDCIKYKVKILKNRILKDIILFYCIFFNILIIFFIFRTRHLKLTTVK